MLATMQQIETWMREKHYPHVAKTSGPLILRSSELSLQVNDVTYSAKIKNGIGYRGYMVYVSGLGVPVYELCAKNDSEFQEVFHSPILQYNANPDAAEDFLVSQACNWIDTLERTLADQPNDDAIKKAIDRLCWQLHYDITESHTDFAKKFKENDFADVQIDKYPMDTDYWDGTTLKTSISDIAGLEFSGGEPTRIYEITNKGYFYDSSERLKEFDDHLTTGAYEEEHGEVTSGAFKTLDIHVNSSLETINSTFGDFDSHLNGQVSQPGESTKEVIQSSLDTIGIKLVPNGNNYHSISECLRDVSDSYSISKALRETGDVSVSNQIKLQADKIESGLGPNGSINTSLGTIDESLGTINTSITNVKGSVDSIGVDTGEIVDKIGSNSQNTIIGCLSNIMDSDSTIVTRIGNYGGDTILGRLLQINGDTTSIDGKV